MSSRWPVFNSLVTSVFLPGYPFLMAVDHAFPEYFQKMVSLNMAIGLRMIRREEDGKIMANLYLLGGNLSNRASVSLSLTENNGNVEDIQYSVIHQNGIEYV